MGCKSLGPSKGLYVLVISLEEPIDFGAKRVKPGIYLYLGSAGGPGGLRGRVCRHARHSGGARKWHVDHLLGAGRVRGAYVLEGVHGVREERLWAEALSLLLEEGAEDFGNTDTGGPSHLFRADGADVSALLGPRWRYVDLTRLR